MCTAVTPSDGCCRGPVRYSVSVSTGQKVLALYWFNSLQRHCESMPDGSVSDYSESDIVAGKCRNQFQLDTSRDGTPSCNTSDVLQQQQQLQLQLLTCSCSCSCSCCGAMFGAAASTSAPGAINETRSRDTSGSCHR